MNAESHFELFIHSCIIHKIKIYTKPNRVAVRVARPYTYAANKTVCSDRCLIMDGCADGNQKLKMVPLRLIHKLRHS